jgi:hypothetical protein
MSHQRETAPFESAGTVLSHRRGMRRARFGLVVIVSHGQTNV